MKTIKLTHPIKSEDIKEKDVVLALGFFDGLHLGHQAVIQAAKNEALARELPLAVLTFTRHPALIYSELHPNDFHYLTTLEQKKELLSQLGVDILYLLDFTSQFSQLSGQEFVDQYVRKLGAKTVVAGHDYSFGASGESNMSDMLTFSHGEFDVIEIAEAKTSHQEEVSSRLIRQALLEGRLKQANRLLTRPYEMRGYIIHGKARGRELGYPTANIYTDPDLLVPAIGVYASRIQIQGVWYDSMTSIGNNVTFGDSDHYTIEAHIFNFNQEIYGESVSLCFYEKIRDEKKFDTLDALVQQLQKDEEHIRQILKKV